MSTVMKPVDAPPRSKGGGIYPWKTIREGLVAQPGQWFHILSDVPNDVARHLKAGAINGFAPEDFEFKTRNNRPVNGVRRCDVYGVYVADEKRKGK